MKILIVDDDVVSSTKMEKILENFGQCTVTGSGDEAINIFQKALDDKDPCTLVTLDISMPGKDGIEVLQCVRDLEKKANIPGHKPATIFMVTSVAQKDSVLSCIQAGCTDYIVKPFNMQTISQKLLGRKLIDHLPEQPGDQAAAEPLSGSTAQSVEAVLKDIVSGNTLLPSLPEVCLKFKDMLQKGPSVKEIAELLRQDMAISAKLISLSNTVMYRGAQENKNLEQAIGRLGLATTKKLVDAISQRSMCNSIIAKYRGYVSSLWEHSLACAYAGQAIAELIRLPQADDFFTLGLLHDIGKLILLQIVSKQEADGLHRDGVGADELYRLLDEQHTMFGATLLKRWGFSETYAAVAQHHHQLDKAGPITREIAVVHCANLLVKSMGFQCLNQAQISLADDDLARVLKVHADAIAGVRQAVQATMDGVKDMFG